MRGPSNPPAGIPIGQRHVLVVVLITAAAAIAERWLFGRAWNESHSLTSAFYYGDAPRFVEYAKAIVQGNVFDNGIPFHPPGWPLVLAAFLRLSGALQHGVVVVPVAAAKLLLACLSGLSVGVAALVAFDIAGAGAMLAVSLLGVFQFAHIVEGTVANSEALYGLCTIAAVGAAWRWLRPSGRGAWSLAALSGAIGGLAMIVRAEFLACAVLIGIVAWRSRAPRTSIAVFVAAFCVVLAPTTVWHWRTLNAFNVSHVGRVAGPLPRFAPVTSYGPFNFAMANHPDADGGPNRDHPLLDRCNQETDERLSAGQLDLQCPEVYDLYVHGYTIGALWILNHPGAALDLMGRKISYTIGFLGHGYFIDDVGPGVEGTRRRVDLIDPAEDWLVPVHLILLVAGLVLLRKNAVALGLMAAPIAALLASALLFYGYVRLGAAYLPVLWIPEGVAVAAGLRRFVTKQPVTPKTMAIVMAVLLALVGVEAARSSSPRALTLVGARTPDGALVQDETLAIRR